MSYRKTLIYVWNSIYKRKFSSSGADGADVLGGLGSGAGKGGGAGGTIREAGGSLGKYGAAKEEEYFYRKQRDQLEELNKQLEKRKQVCKHAESVEHMDDIIQKNRKRIARLEKCLRKK
ncbi:ATPase inhibitor mai-1, mitochondrial-like [Anoplophora glabripennis]|uniref:ATPase inhibitor mai-1, mitochondrial-like n=1 Tax=Anoplophora glabripennis TaxID=217634 RepID=UPI0008754A52|nr:ATPase inhibitor mai-1, mitochondrial-like [Anoplophora glabripennis]